MKSIDLTVTIPNGFHARPISHFITQAKKFSSHIEIKYKNRTANGKSIMSVLSLCVPYGGKITITAEGMDEDTAISVLSDLLNKLE